MYVLSVYLGSHGLENGGNISRLTGVLVNPAAEVLTENIIQKSMESQLTFTNKMFIFLAYNTLNLQVLLSLMLITGWWTV